MSKPISNDDIDYISDLAEQLAPRVIGGNGFSVELDADQTTLFYHILTDFIVNNQMSDDLPKDIRKALGEVA